MILSPDKQELNLRRMEMPEQGPPQTAYADFLQRIETLRHLGMVDDTSSGSSSTQLRWLLQEATHPGYAMGHYGAAFLWTADILKREQGIDLGNYLKDDVSYHRYSNSIIVRNRKGYESERYIGLRVALSICAILPQEAAQQLLVDVRTGGMPHDPSGPLVFDSKAALWMHKRKNDSSGYAWPAPTLFQLHDILVEARSGDRAHARERFEKLRSDHRYYSLQQGLWGYNEEDNQFETECVALIAESAWDTPAARAAYDHFKLSDRYHADIDTSFMIDSHLLDFVVRQTLGIHAAQDELFPGVPPQPLKKVV